MLFEDDSILILDKPFDWVVNSAETTKNMVTIQDWLKLNFKYEIVNSFEMRSGIVHRLDKETSGVLIIAKTPEAFTSLQKQFADRIVTKKYAALIHGVMEPLAGEIVATVGRLPWRRDRFGVLPGGREASTAYETVKTFTVPNSKTKKTDLYSLLLLTPKTGRTHQIRIHLKYKGHPIVSDTFYAGRKTARADRLWCPRLFLHAKYISFIHPKTGKRVEFEADLSLDLVNTLIQLDKLIDSSLN